MDRAPAALGGALSRATDRRDFDARLTGQQITATLNLHSAPINTNVPIAYRWSCTGGSPFETWNPKTVPQMVPLSATDADATGAYFTYNNATNQDSVTVQCTATIPFLDGTTGTVTAKSQPVMFMKPKVSAWLVNTNAGPQAGLSGGVVQAGTSTDQFNKSYYTIYATEVWGPITISGTTLGTTAIGGQGCIAQVIKTDGDTDTRSTGNPYVDAIENANGNYVALPVPYLDTAFPFPFGYGLDAHGLMTVQTGTSVFQVTQNGYSGDQPSVRIFPNSTDAWTKSTLSDTFNTWVMYQPPNGIYVPLQMLSWSPSDSGSPNPLGLVIDPVDQSHWFVPTTNFSGGTGTDTSNYPAWIGSDAGAVFAPLTTH